MATHSVPKEYFASESHAWVHLANKHGLNSDMVASTAHTDTEYVWHTAEA